MSSRGLIQPDPRFVELQPGLFERLDRIARSVHPEEFNALFDPLMRAVLRQGFAAARADEGTIWLPDETEEHLIPVHNTGPNAERFVGKFKQPIHAGLLCLVYANEQPFVENEVYRNSLQSKLLDQELGLQTYALIAVPFCFLKGCRGVVSCVQLKDPRHPGKDPDGFNATALSQVEQAVAILSRLLELRLIGATIGWSE